MIKTFIRAKGVEKIIITSDASPIAGLAPGPYETMGNKVELTQNGKLYSPQTGYMAGSSATMLECMNHPALSQMLTVEQLLEVGFHNPLGLIGVDVTQLRSMGGLNYDEQRGMLTKVRRS